MRELPSRKGKKNFGIFAMMFVVLVVVVILIFLMTPKKEVLNCGSVFESYEYLPGIETQGSLLPREG